jgi:hypothetical protein
VRSGESALGAVEEATAEAAKHGDRSESLAALVAEARATIEHARAMQAERARAAAEKAAAAAAAKAALEAEAAAEEAEADAERLQIEQEMAALKLRLKQMKTRAGSSVAPPAAPVLDQSAECVLCFDAPKDHILVPCGHQCVCGACAKKLKKAKLPCPFCRAPIHSTVKVFVV